MSLGMDGRSDESRVPKAAFVMAGRNRVMMEKKPDIWARSMVSRSIAWDLRRDMSSDNDIMVV